MNVAKGFLQATIVAMWAIYAVTQIISNAGSTSDGSADPTGGADLLVGHLETLPIEPLVLPTVVMVIGILGLEVAFAAIRRA